MGYDFNADEIFQIAEQIEVNGENFYRQMADNIADKDIRKLFLDFAAMEVGHQKVFASMRAALSDKEREPTVFDPEGEAALYLQALADLRVFGEEAEGPFTLPEGLNENERLKKIFWAAAGREKESIVFYTGMKEMVGENLGRNKIDEIIREEMTHLRILSNKIASLK
jgi:rubrerythrin